MIASRQLTREQHIALGKKLDIAQKSIRQSITMIDPVTTKNDRALKKLWRIVDLVNEARSYLDARAVSEYGDDCSFIEGPFDEDLFNAYYGPCDECRGT